MIADLCITCGYWVATIGDQCEACGGDPTENIQGPTFCDKHPQTVWPHGDCAGPGVCVSNGTLRQWGLIPKDELDALRAERADLMNKLLHYEGWFGDECRCGGDDCPLGDAPVRMPR